MVANNVGGRVKRYGQRLQQAVALIAIGTLVLSPVAWADRTALKPGWNMFSLQQDVEVGQQVSRDAERQLSMLNNSRVDNYVNTLGRKLAAKAPGEKYPYQFRVVNDRAINAFALPGGPIYINRGVIEAANTESQLAGVIAHETSHVALRHGTNQASKASAAQVPLAILGGMLGSNSTGAMLAQLGAGFAVNSVLLKYSRTAESQADLMGTQILYDSKLDTRGMAQFFEVIQAENQGGRQVEFFSNHPNPDNRIAKVNQEITKLGGSQRGYKSDSREFQDIKKYVQSLPAPPAKGTTQGLQGDPNRDDRGQRDTRDWPSDRFKTFENPIFSINHPDNWQAYGQGDAVTITPRDGLVSDGKGNQALAYGVIVNIYEPHADQYSQQLQGRGYGQQNRQQDSHFALEQATDQLIQELRQSNRNMRVIQNHEHFQLNGQPAQSTYLSNDSPTGGRETNWLVTVARPEGLLFFVFVAPERDFQNSDNIFQAMLNSVRIRR